MRKITVSLPQELVEFADNVAATMKMSRSKVIAEALTAQREQEEKSCTPVSIRRGRGTGGKADCRSEVLSRLH
jgi:metal-responsive CopG/Arc/MetJ family transcriptional regulator